MKNELGTDGLKAKFGKVKPEVIYQDGSRRVTLVKAEDGVIGACSIVRFDDFGIKCMPEIHEKIVKGQRFIGETFKAHGVPVSRDEKCVFVYGLPKEVQKTFNTELRESFCKGLTFRIGHVGIPYASITELYSPEIGFNDLFEKEEGSVKLAVEELEQEFKEDSNYFITRLKPEELDSYLKLAYEFLKKPAHVGIENQDEFVKQTLETGIGLLMDSNTIQLVAQNKAGFIGYLAANIHPALHVNGLECMIRELYVKNEFRRMGVASSLVRTVEKLAQERGSKRVSLATNMGDEMQHSFYSGLGYQRRCDFDVKYLGV
ncbi:GNAT family N-acetyltransferase [Candidatus Pacearchaeota archaeon]|nr:GNAT family N-acetyltransferase [Candidatus Pacearchaeota archaeon]